MFLESSTIHGLAYLSTNQSRSTRIIWTIIVLTAFGIASYFLYEAIEGFDTKYTSTTIEDRRINEFPFPAVTFDPGELNSENSFLRTFLNQFEFTRYVENSSLKNNDEFLKQFAWLVAPMQNDILNGVEKFLPDEKEFIKKKGGIFKKEVCILVSLDKIERKRLSKMIRKIFLENMYKYRGFNAVKTFLKQEVSPIIMASKSRNNLTKSVITASCNRKDGNSLQTKSEMEAMILSYFYMFINEETSEVGAGDIATSTLMNGLVRKKGNEQQYYYKSMHSQFTSIYNNLTKANLPASILKFPSFFTMPEKILRVESIDTSNGGGENFPGAIFKIMLDFINVTSESMQNYHFLWWSYNHRQNNFTLFCFYKGNQNNCSNHRGYIFVDYENVMFNVDSIRNNPSLGRLIEEVISEPPCTNKDIIKKLKIEKICILQKQISDNKEAFLKLMKFTKQSPIYLEEDEEYRTIFQNINSTLQTFGYNWRKDKVRL